MKANVIQVDEKSAQQYADYARKMQLNPYQRTAAKIVGGREHWGSLLDSRKEPDWKNWIARGLKNRKRTDLIRSAYMEPTGSAVYARVEASRWIADCECGGAEVVEPMEPYFFCLNCLNAGNNFRTRTVKFPAEKADIEKVLEKRPEVLTRNYTPEIAIIANPMLALRGFQPDDMTRIEIENVLKGVSAETEKEAQQTEGDTEVLNGMVNS